MKNNCLFKKVNLTSSIMKIKSLFMYVFLISLPSGHTQLCTIK